MSDRPAGVLILGHGEMGRAMEHLLRDRSPRLWERRDGAAALQAAVAASDIILMCVPATAVAELAATLRPQLAPAALAVTIAKGLDNAGRTPVETLAAEIGPARLAALYGPMISEEIRAGKPAFAQCGTGDTRAFARIAAVFAGSPLRLEPAHDLTGLAWSAILKNVYAIAFGMADELALGDNVRGFLTVAALHELDAIVRQQGGAPATPFHLAGLGDLITTATSRSSHHHELGRLIVRGERERLTGEGVHTLTTIRTRRLIDTDRHALLRLIDDCVREPQDVRARLIDYLQGASPG